MKILLKILKGIIVAFLFIILIVVLLQKITNNKIAIGNFYIFQVVSPSMEPDYKVGDIILVNKTNPENINIGDDVTYLGKESNLANLIITHRVVDKQNEDGKNVYTTKGTANKYEDPQITDSDIYGKVIYHTVLFSFVGRLMTNIIIYYILFILVGVSFAYEIISTLFFKKE